MSEKHPIPAHEPRSIKSNLFAEAPAQGGILAPGGPSSGAVDRHPGEDRDPFAPVHTGRPARQRASSPKSAAAPKRKRPKRKRASSATPAAPPA
jgi:hypothetical protein